MRPWPPEPPFGPALRSRHAPSIPIIGLSCPATRCRSPQSFRNPPILRAQDANSGQACMSVGRSSDARFLRTSATHSSSSLSTRSSGGEFGITAAAASTIHRWVRKFGPEIRKRAYGAYRSWRGLQWHVAETYIRVGGRWCYLWRAVDQFGQLIVFRLTARRNAKAARANLKTARPESAAKSTLSGGCSVRLPDQRSAATNLFPSSSMQQSRQPCRIRKHRARRVHCPLTGPKRC